MQGALGQQDLLPSIEKEEYGLYWLPDSHEEYADFWFVSAEALLELKECEDFGPFQKIQRERPDMFVRRRILLSDICRAWPFRLWDILTISHRWIEAGAPDKEGVQFKAIQEHLEANKSIKWVWYDYWCMPQDEPKGTRTGEETEEFKKMLKAANLLYLGTYVLILLDLSYTSRFWTQFGTAVRPPPAHPTLT